MKSSDFQMQIGDFEIARVNYLLDLFYGQSRRHLFQTIIDMPVLITKTIK